MLDLLIEYFEVSSQQELPPSLRIQDIFHQITENLDSSQKDLVTVGRFEVGRALYESMKRY